MTLNGFPGDPAVVSMDGQRVDIFARAPDDTLLHVWLGTGDDGAESLGGRLAGDPVAVSAGPGRLDVFAREFGFWMRHWRWNPVANRMNEADVRWHDFRLAYDPVAVAVGPGLAVYARSATDDLLHWRSADGSEWEPLDVVGGAVTSAPAVVHRTGLPDVFARSATGGLSHWGMIHVDGAPDDREGWEDLGGEVTSTPVVLSWSTDRLDVLANTSTEVSLHWGWAGRQRFHDDLGVWHTGRWFGAEESVDGPLGPQGTAVSHGRNLADVYGRSPDGKLQKWSWDGTQGWDPFGRWERTPDIADRLASNPAALIRNGRTEVYAWEAETGALLQIAFDGTQWVRTTIPIRLRNRPGPQLPPTRVAVAPEFVVMRPDDLAIVGVSWTGYDLVDGDPPVLQRNGAMARLTLALPPQHVGEEVARGPGAPVPPVDETGGSPFGRWRAVLSGPSRLVVAPTAERIELTPEGLLAAAQDVPVVTDDADGSPATQLELPWQLTVAPNGARSEHPSKVPAGAGTVALWRAALRPVDGAALSLSILDSGGGDPFEMPLGRAARGLLEAQTGPADLHRLEVSALGATLSAAGSWDSVEWEHETSLGRDQRVRLLVRGTLYPFGHRAEYVELTERFSDADDDAQPIAVLRKRSILTITEPVRDHSADPLGAFPFDVVEIATLQLTDLDAPSWTFHTRMPRPVGDADPQLAALHAELASQPEMPGDFHGGPPLMEHLINAVDDLGGEGSPEGEEEAATQARLAADYLQLIESIQRTEEQIAALQQAREQPVPWYFWPRRGGSRASFTVCSRTGSGVVELALPLLFVADVALPRTETMEPFDSLGDPQALARAWATERDDPAATDPNTTAPDDERAGVVATDGSTLDLIRSGNPASTGDRHIVHRLNLFAVEQDGRGFRPRLGPSLGAPVDWAVDVALPALRTMLPDRPEAHSALVRYSDEFETAGSAVDVALKVVGEAVDVDFTNAADRSGGLISPKIAVDGLSRSTGLVNAAGLETLDPEKLFAEGASLLGFSLASLVRSLPDPPGAPELTTDLTTTPPTVKMAWTSVPLEDAAPFGPVGDPEDPATPVPTLTLIVESSGASTTTECTITDFALTFPTTSPLLTLTFRRLHYLQRDGRAPTIDVDGIKAEFTGALDVLQALQDKVDLGDTGAQIHADADGIAASYSLPVPDAAAGAFVMRNLSFHAGVVVPFRGDPVSVGIGFASREKPFNLSVMMIGGGGYANVELDHHGLRRLEISLEFGASVAVTFAIAEGEAHVLGGIRFELMPDDSVLLTGFIRIGGSLEVLGLVSVSVELLLTLGYQTTGNRLVGRATLVIEIDVTLFSDSVELDSGEWVISGDDVPASGDAPDGPLFIAEEADPYLLAWLEHRQAFEPR